MPRRVKKTLTRAEKNKMQKGNVQRMRKVKKLMEGGEEMQGMADKKKVEEIKEGKQKEKLARTGRCGMKTLREI